MAVGSVALAGASRACPKADPLRFREASAAPDPEGKNSTEARRGLVGERGALHMRHADAVLCFPAHRSFCGCKHQRVCYRNVLDILFELQRLHLRVRIIDIQLKARHEAGPGRVHEHDRPIVSEMFV